MNFLRNILLPTQSGGRWESMSYKCRRYNLSSESWRKPIYNSCLHSHHVHLLDLENSHSMSCEQTAFCTSNFEEHCVFCQADSTFDRTVEEILYHFSKRGNENEIAHLLLMNKWRKNVDAWGNPIGNNIKG